MLGGLNLATARGIEIGPLCRPIVDKAESQVLYVDHADTESLRRKFASNPNVDVDKILDIDGVWGEQSLQDCLGDRADFDYVIAFHVMEHVPDLVGWLNEIDQVLRPGGLLCLAIPDRRYTFDYNRRSSGLADVIEAFVRKNRRPTPVQIFDALSKAAMVDLDEAWEGRRGPLQTRAPGNQARGSRCRTATDQGLTCVAALESTPVSPAQDTCTDSRFQGNRSSICQTRLRILNTVILGLNRNLALTTRIGECIRLRQGFRDGPKSGVRPALISWVQRSSRPSSAFQNDRQSLRYSSTVSRSPASSISLARIMLGPNELSRRNL